MYSQELESADLEEHARLESKRGQRAGYRGRSDASVAHRGGGGGHAKRARQQRSE